MIRIKGHLHTGPDGLGIINRFVMDISQVVNDLDTGYMIGTPYYERSIDGYICEWTVFVPDQFQDKALSAISSLVPAGATFKQETKKFIYGHFDTKI